MQAHLYKRILYFIIVAIAISMAMQVYWNYKNYQASKQQLVNEVQTSLDNAVEDYYTDIAENNLLGISLSENAKHLSKKQIDSVFIQLEGTSTNTIEKIQISDSNNYKKIAVFTGSDKANTDTLLKHINISNPTKKQLVKWHLNKDTLTDNTFFELTSRVIFAMTNDSLNLKKLDSLVHNELDRKKINIRHNLVYKNELGNIQRNTQKKTIESDLKTISKSTYLPKKALLTLSFNNATVTILKRNSISLLLSLLFMVAVISCLLYLLKIIQQQKKLAEIKDDLISNITHEFKTPIATIGAAVEGIQHFNPENDNHKTQRYAKISSEQVEKLNTMVEKLLETATLDKEQLELHLEEIDLVILLQHASKKEAFITEEKEITFHTSETKLLKKIDVFHFENAINNIIDNALKYGGNKIEVSISKTPEIILITILDNGKNLKESHKKQIFEKFFRVPKGNTHDVKGFGIGLFYAKTIIEKHDGQVAVSLNPTTFKIKLPLD